MKTHFSPEYRFFFINTCDGSNDEVSTEVEFLAYGCYTPSNRIYIQDITNVNPVLGDTITLSGWSSGMDGTFTIIQIFGIPGHWAVILDSPTCTDPPHGGTSGTAILNHVEFVPSNERVQCFPHNFQAERSYKWKREQDQIFYRKNLDGELRFHDIPGKGVNDWSFLKNIYDNDKCCEIKFIIEKKCNGEWVEDFAGFFAHNDATWDFNKCVVSVSILPDDEYRCILENWEQEINLLAIAADFETVTVPSPFPFTDVELERCKDLREALQYFLSNLCENLIDVRSNFFEINAVDDNPFVPYTVGENYVITYNNSFFGESNDNTNLFNNILFTPSIDVEVPIPSNPSTIYNMTFKEMQEMLRVMFNVYWWIDNGYLRFEHFNYFNNSQILNFTIGLPKKINYHTDVIQFTKYKMPSREIWSWSNDFTGVINPDFKGFPVTYDSVCTIKSGDGSVKYYRASKIDVNLYGLLFRHDAISDGSLCLIACNGSNVAITTVLGLGLDVPNNPMDYYYLLYNFHRANRILMNGNMNLIQQSFSSAIKTKSQADQVYIDCCAQIEPFLGTVLTTQGQGEIDEVEFSIKNNRYLFKLLFND